MADEEAAQLKAGHPAAVKAGGMRIVQHKTPNTERPAKDLEDCTGLTVPPNITPSTTTVSGVTVKGVHDYPTEAVQAAHAPKIPQSVPQKPMHHINQPRKWIVKKRRCFTCT